MAMTENVRKPDSGGFRLLTQAESLSLVLDEEGGLRIGTCGHCVQIQGRPERAEEPGGDESLDFDRDSLLAELAGLGVQTIITDEYVCP